MRATGVDPRDVTWEDDAPTYRVYMWHRPDPPPDIGASEMGYWCDEYRLTEASDIHEVLAWAEKNVPDGDTYTLYVESSDQFGTGRGPGLLLLAGVDPTVSLD